VPGDEPGADDESGAEREDFGEEPVDRIDRAADPPELGTLADPADSSAA
jgi:hypothetical protein